jgi:hypothetical protein
MLVVGVSEPFSPPSTRRRRRVASRLVSVQAATYAIVVATAVALIVYFAIRG